MKKRFLRELRKNQPATIRKINATGETGRRLRDMGLVPGTDIMVVGRAPLQDPVALRLKDCTLSLRNSEADYILVEEKG